MGTDFKIHLIIILITSVVVSESTEHIITNNDYFETIVLGIAFLYDLHKQYLGICLNEVLHKSELESNIMEKLRNILISL